jgi:cobalt-zinc-cadmium resistance protein CzcA
LAIKVFGDDLAELKRISEEVARITSTVPGAIDLRVERLSGQQTLTIEIDRQSIARYGINVSDVNDLIETAFGGNEVGQLYEGQRRFAIVVRYPQENRNSIQAIRNTTLKTRDGTLVPLSAVASIELVDSPPTISREFGKRRVVVGANVSGRDLGGFVQEVQRRVDAELTLPDGYYLSWGGQFENMERAMETLTIIVPLTIVAIFFLLFMLFNSVRLATLIILVLPFASIGGVIALFVSGEYISVPASVGFIALWGIAVLNGVVLVSSIRKLREDGMSVAAAVREGCVQRFRPVLMTATVALLALVPFLFATGPGSEVQRPLAVVVIGGLISSTLLTLVVLPALYRWFDDVPQEA